MDVNRNAGIATLLHMPTKYKKICSSSQVQPFHFQTPRHEDRANNQQQARAKELATALINTTNTITATKPVQSAAPILMPTPLKPFPTPPTQGPQTKMNPPSSKTHYSPSHLHPSLPKMAPGKLHCDSRLPYQKSSTASTYKPFQCRDQGSALRSSPDAWAVDLCKSMSKFMQPRSIS